jgi:hypothetical protein
MKIDLHTHSRCSDGSLTVEELVELAAELHISTLSITEHDTSESVSRALAAGYRQGVEIIPGIEISAFDPETERKVHILGYGYKPPAGALKSLCNPMLERRHENTIRQIAAISGAGIEITEEEVRREAGESRMLYKQHIMAVLVRKGYTDDIYSALYTSLFKGDGVAAGDITYVHYRDAIAAVLEDGGVPVLAHPGQQQCLDLVETMVREGLEGIELNHPDHTMEMRLEIIETAKRYGLLLTGGSDFHGDYGSPATLGEFTAPSDFTRKWKKQAGVVS